MFRFLSLTCIACLLSACSNLMFYPMKQHVIDPGARGVEYQDISVNTANNQQLHGWLFPQVGELKGTVLFFHGNAENISTHAGAVYWLPQYGYRVILVDYRGYGKSQGAATLAGSIEDIQYSIQYVLENYTDAHPFIVLGQSIGASMSVYAVATSPLKSYIDALVLVAPFSDYRQITRETLARSWITWLFQYPLSWTITDDYSPARYIQDVSPVPVFFIHGTTDEIISSGHSEHLYRLAKEPKQLVLMEGRHNTLVSNEKFHEALLLILRQVASSQSQTK